MKSLRSSIESVVQLATGNPMTIVGGVVGDVKLRSNSSAVAEHVGIRFRLTDSAQAATISGSGRSAYNVTDGLYMKIGTQKKVVILRSDSKKA